MRAHILLSLILMIAGASSAWCQVPACEALKNKSQPQSTPEETYQLELAMMRQGIYCHDLAIFDQAWQARASKNYANENLKATAQYFDAPSKVFQEGKYAIIYYPMSPTLGPVFLIRENGKWVLDRTSVYQYIHYEDRWLAYDGDYPYLEMLKTVYPLEERTTSNGQKVYKVREE
jgi:hypothetical protein